MGRLPAESDFPSRIKLAIVPPPNGDAATNVLILLHGLGDSHESFANLGRQMKLPETVCIAIRGPQNLLDLGGYHFGDDIIFDSSTGGIDADAGFKTSDELLKSVVKDALIEKCGYKLRDVVFFGFGQGGMAALNAAVNVHQGASDTSNAEVGGVISIGAGLPSSAPASLTPKSKTPVLVCAGTDSSAVTSSTEDKLKHVFEFFEIKRYRRSGDGMPNNRDEMMPIMQFFSRRLRSMKGVPEGSVEVG